MDYHTTHATIASLALDDFAEWCSVDILTEGGELESVIVAHSDPKKVEWAKEFSAKYPTDLKANTGVPRVLRSGEPILISAVTDEMIVNGALTEEHLADIRSVGLGSLIITPLIARGLTLGAITFVHSSMGQYEERDLELAQEIAILAALALDNSRLFTRLQRELGDRKRAEIALDESEIRFRELADAMPVIVWTINKDAKIEFTNRFFHEYTGELDLSQPDLTWSKLVHPDDRLPVRESYRHAIENKIPWEKEVRMLRSDGEYRWHLSRTLPVIDESGEVLRWYGTSTEIHEQKTLARDLEIRVEQRTCELQETVREAEAFNHSVSHDLRAPLRTIIMTSQMLLEELSQKLDPEYVNLLERQAKNAKKLGQITEELLRLSKVAKGEVSRQAIDVTSIACSIVAELTTQGQQNAEVDVQGGMQGIGDPGLVRMVLLNLIENAYKFSPQGGCIRVTQQSEIFSVTDEGIGFDPKDAERIFMPFERLVTEDEFPGTGIGLANVERIVRRHGGRVWAEAQPGNGSAFRFTLGSNTPSRPFKNL